MFTGLVREVGRVEAIGRRAAITLLDLSAPLTAPGLSIGDSLAVNGICLTATRATRERVRVEATEETRRVTTLARWRPGDRVHLEPSLRVGEEIGGHFVLGHVDGVGRISGFEPRGGAAVMTVDLPERLAAELLPKGSIAVDGVSLTLDAGPFPGRFSVTLVPHTLSATRFGGARPGELVNVELDVLAKSAARAVAARAPGREGVWPAQAPPTGRQPASSSPSSGLTLESIRARGWGSDSGR